MDKVIDLVKGFVAGVVTVTIAAHAVNLTYKLFTYRLRNEQQQNGNTVEE